MPGIVTCEQELTLKNTNFDLQRMELKLERTEQKLELELKRTKQKSEHERKELELHPRKNITLGEWPYKRHDSLSNSVSRVSNSGSKLSYALGFLLLVNSDAFLNYTVSCLTYRMILSSARSSDSDKMKLASWTLHDVCVMVIPYYKPSIKGFSREHQQRKLTLST